MRRGGVTLALAACAAAAGCNVHVREPGQNPAVACTGIHPDRRRPGPDPGTFLDDHTYGGTASWTYDGDPPAGDRCSRPPPGVTPRRVP